MEASSQSPEAEAEAEAAKKAEVDRAEAQLVALLKANPTRFAVNHLTFRYCSRRVRRAFERAYLKKHGVPKPKYESAKERKVFARLNKATMFEMMATEGLAHELPKMNLAGGRP